MKCAMGDVVSAGQHGGLIVDSFAGGGGASTGIEWALGRSPDIAINHSPEAIAMHRLNHPATRRVVLNDGSRWLWDARFNHRACTRAGA